MERENWKCNFDKLEVFLRNPFDSLGLDYLFLSLSRIPHSRFIPADGIEELLDTWIVSDRFAFILAFAFSFLHCTRY